MTQKSITDTLDTKANSSDLTTLTNKVNTFPNADAILYTKNNDDHIWLTCINTGEKNPLKFVDIGVNATNKNLFTHVYYKDGAVQYLEYQHI